ncbi:unnamed protein product, partial [Meganyctiphanes norvegica]
MPFPKIQFQQYQSRRWIFQWLRAVCKVLSAHAKMNIILQRNSILGMIHSRWIRARHFEYEYEPMGNPDAVAGIWYRRTLKGSYLPPVDIEMLEPLFSRMRWKTIKLFKKNKLQKS